MTKHFKFGGSTAARTIQCPAWIRLSEDVPKSLGNGSNPAADEGTMLHMAMEDIYGANYPDVEPEDLLEAKHHYKAEYLTQDLIDEKLIPAIDAVENLMDELGITDWMLEPLLQINIHTGGSIDFLALSEDGRTLLILDYKFGFHSVSAEHNAQLQFYALAVAEDEKTAWMFEHVDRIVYAIVQPNGEGEVVSRWDSNLEELDAFETRYFDAVADSNDPDYAPAPGSGCKYCPAHATCPAKTGMALKASRVNEVTAGKLAEYLPMAEQLTEWIKEVQKMAYEQMELGTHIPGYKLVAKRASRVWTDEKGATDRIKKAKKIKIVDGFDMKLKSPAQLEKKCKELGIDFAPYTAYITSVSSGSTLAKESDKRPALLPIQGLTQLNAMND